MTTSLSQDEFDRIKAFSKGELARLFGAPFDPFKANDSGVWHLPRDPISWDYAGITVFKPVDPNDEVFSGFLARLFELLKSCEIRWTILVYEQSMHRGDWVCSAEPVAIVDETGVTYNAARFTQEVELVPDGKPALRVNE